AEDGIRDFHVTGVQTCALPISDGAGPRIAGGEDECRWTMRQLPSLSWAIITVATPERTASASNIGIQRYSITPHTNAPILETCRSEERRVGKEREYECNTHYCT